MRFRTEYEMRRSDTLLNVEESVVLIGSCFTDNIGNRMRMCRWKAFPNETGTLFNPSSIARILEIACDWNDIFDIIKDSTVSNGELWMSWLMDSKCTSYREDNTKERAFSRLLSLRNKLKYARTLIVTFGTAWIYELKERPGYVVTNCHKFPQDVFVRRRLSVSEIVARWDKILGKLQENYPGLRVIFTVSPVRHLKDGFEGNSRSKAILQLACEEICGKDKNADYFPAYEIMNDDLRDYRFYASDLVHPSDEGVDYIWHKFQERYLSKESMELLALGEKVTKRLNHRPILYGDSGLAQYKASLERYRADEYYNEFMKTHPNMLRDE